MHPFLRRSRSWRPISTLRPMAVIDPLERRCLLAASLAADGTLEVIGTDGPDAITLRLGAGANHLNVQEGTTTLFVFLLDRITSVSVKLGAGDDTLNLDTGPGLLSGAAGELPIRFEGGDGTDALRVFGAPAGGGVSEILTIGPAAGAGTLTSRAAAGFAQSVQFAGVESFVDTSAAALFTVAGTDGSNLVELTSGPPAGGVTPTGTVRFSDVSPVSATASVGPNSTTTTSDSGRADVAAAGSVSGALTPISRKEAKRQAKEAKREAQKLAKEAKRLAREQKRAEGVRNRKGAAGPVAVPAQPAAPQTESFRIDRIHFPIHFANKAAVTIEARGGDDRIDLNFAGAAPAGLASLTIDGGAGADRLYEQSAPVGVAVLRVNVEATSTTRDFTLVTDRPPVVEPPIPDAPPPPIPDDGDDSVDEDREDKDDSRDDSVDEDRKAKDDSRDDSVDEDRGDDDDDDD